MSKPAQSLPRLRLRITAAAERTLRTGHPWVFAGSVREQNREGTPGELAVVYDRQDRFLAVGLFDPGSPIRLRVLHCGDPVAVDAAWWDRRLESALERRHDLAADAVTDGFRWINGESDGWPGLVLDRYAGTLVLKLYTAAWLSRLDDTAARIRARLNPERLVLRLSRNIQAAAATVGHTDGEVLFGPAPEGPVTFLESGLRFEADVWRGQKTGFFLDQRENRRRVGALAAGRRVLNAFSFSGGFSLYAARGGARSVTDLDLSAHALESARRNFQLNAHLPEIAACRHEPVRADAFDWLAARPAGGFGLVILDPPSLAKRETERAGAIDAYERLARHGLRLLEPEGILLACSCSAHVSAEEFFRAVRAAAARSGRTFQEIGVTRHAPDHHASFPEAEYLKGIYLRLGRR